MRFELRELNCGGGVVPGCQLPELDLGAGFRDWRCGVKGSGGEKIMVGDEVKGARKNRPLEIG